MGATIPTVIKRAAKLYGDKKGVVCGARSFTYSAFYDRASRLASALRGIGLGKGDRFAIVSHNCHRFLESYFAASLLGSILVPLNVKLLPVEIADLLDLAGAKLLVAPRRLAKTAEEVRERSGELREIIGFADDDSPVGSGYDRDFDEMIEGASPLPADEDPAEEDDPAQIYFTSGTTGKPKGVVLTHRNVLSHALGTIAELRLRDSDVWIHAAPLFHLADAWATFAVTWLGAGHVLLREPTPASFIEEVERESVTVTNLIPTMLNRIIHSEEASPDRLESMRIIMSGGAPIAPALVKQAMSLFGCEYVQTYGLTETSPYLTMSTVMDHLADLDEEALFRIRASTGKEVLGVEMRLVDEGGGEIPADGKAVGEIIVRGDRVTPGYWKNREETEKAFSGDWFRTGDLATIDPDGYVRIVDRKKDVIITGGENVYSTEVENALYQHPSVLEAAVIGVPDEEWGEAIKAFVVLKEGVEATGAELKTFLEGRLAPFKIPKSFDFPSSIPKTGSGKINKRKLRAPYWKDLDKKVH